MGKAIRGFIKMHMPHGLFASQRFLGTRGLS